MATARRGSERLNLLGLPQRRLNEVLGPYIDRRFRVDQIYRAIYERRVRDFSAMSELSQKLRACLDKRFSVERPQIVHRHISADGTVKYLLRLDDGASIETVDIPEASRRTLCLSSQAGCALACRFCVTGYWGGGRNLNSGDIIAQYLIAQSQPSLETDRLNIVFMGMGEPLLNMQGLADALEILYHCISPRRITVSTAGIVPAIEKMALWHQRPRLAISLHAPDDERRSVLMPINHRYPLPELMATLKKIPLAKRERITFEYILISHFNDSVDDATAISRLLRSLPAKVNLIPLNPDPVLSTEFVPSPPHRVEAFRSRLVECGLVATVRRQRGDDVRAACGQLRAFGRQPRGFQHTDSRGL